MTEHKPLHPGARVGFTTTIPVEVVLAAGLTLVFGLMDVLNFGHGVFIALGAFVGMSVLGAEGDRITPVEHARWLAAHFGARLHLFHGGHILQFGRADAFREVGRVFEVLEGDHDRLADSIIVVTPAKAYGDVVRGEW